MLNQPKNEDYRIDLHSYAGPLDLLLYLIRKEELDIYDIPIGRILDQYLAYLDLIKRVNLDDAGEFLVMASTLMVMTRMTSSCRRIRRSISCTAGAGASVRR